MAPFTILAFYVQPNFQRAVFCTVEQVESGPARIMTVTYDPLSTSFLGHVYFRAWDILEPTLERSKILTQRLNDNGETPIITLSDSSISLHDVTFDSSIFAWVASLSGKSDFKTFGMIVKKSNDCDVLVKTTRFTISLRPESYEGLPHLVKPPISPAVPLDQFQSMICNPCSLTTCIWFNSTHLVLSLDMFFTFS
uniref:Uncharacterized protein n=2 Tax=Spongospora subterranea TaxID=70186 RepID=A0A0H5QNR6_9EUKA|eukprot:CRZ03224.1 hypothetical protein [Spongospora subterranea]